MAAVALGSIEGNRMARRVRIGAPAIGRGYRFTVLSFARSAGRLHRGAAAEAQPSAQVLGAFANNSNNVRSPTSPIGPDNPFRPR